MTQRDLIDDYLKDLTFMTVYNDAELDTQDNGKAVKERAVAHRHRVNLSVPQTDIFNLKINEFQAQDDQIWILPLETTWRPFTTTFKSISETESD